MLPTVRTAASSGLTHRGSFSVSGSTEVSFTTWPSARQATCTSARIQRECRWTPNSTWSRLIPPTARCSDGLKCVRMNSPLRLMARSCQPRGVANCCCFGFANELKIRSTRDPLGGHEEHARPQLKRVLARPNSNRSENQHNRRMPMKYMISWFERPQGSPMEYENAQKRILDVFGQWKAPANFKIEFFVVRVGEWGGHMLVDCDDPVTVHKFCSMLPSFVFEARPVIPVEEAVRGELEVMAWRDGLKGK